ncbi:MAG TPA: hypothetical protein PLO59_06385 [Bacteroidia bacterium]|nr:hypothetical protein [Bacteroidia bacterium]
MDNSNTPPNNARFIYPNFKLIFHNYQFYNTAFDEQADSFLFDQDTSQLQLIFEAENALALLAKKDTLHLQAYVFNALGGIQIQVIPNRKTDRFKVAFALGEEIIETFDNSKFNRVDYESSEAYTQAIQNWDAGKVFYKAISKYQGVNDSAKYFFQLPAIDLNVYEQKIKQRLHLKDTLVDRSGESENIATIIYKNKACRYFINHVYLRINRYADKKLIEAKHIVIEIYYGC